MKILYNGNDNLQNQAIIEILKSEKDFEVNQLLPIQLEEKVIESDPQTYVIALVDLSSFTYSPDVSIAMVKKNHSSNL